MSLFLATLLFGLFLAAVGGLLVANQPVTNASLRALPRSETGALVLFGGASLWFLWIIWHSSSSDNFDHPGLLTVGFALVAALSFKCVPDFLAVRGLSVLTLLAGWHLRDAAYMEYGQPLRLLMVAPLFVLLGLAIWLGVQPYRLRDFIGWLLTRPARARTLGAVVLAYGLLVSAVAFTY